MDVVIVTSCEWQYYNSLLHVIYGYHEKSFINAYKYRFEIFT
jgi:hypothetical protein